MTFSAYLQGAISMSWRLIGFLRLVSKDLYRNTFNQCYKLDFRPHLDYGNIIDHITRKRGQHITSSEKFLMEKLEIVQYAAALKLTGTWRCAFQERLYNEIGWGSSSLTI